MCPIIFNVDLGSFQEVQPSTKWLTFLLISVVLLKLVYMYTVFRVPLQYAYSKTGDFACQYLGDVAMKMHAKFDQNIPCGSRVINIFTNC